MLFNFTLLNADPVPCPATMDIETDIGIYLKFYVFVVIKFAPTLLLLTLVLLVAAVDVRQERHCPPSPPKP